MELIELAGTFWSRWYDCSVFRSIIKVQEELAKQNAKDRELLMSLSNIGNMKIVRTVLQHPLTLLQSECVENNKWKLDDDIVCVPSISEEIFNLGKILYCEVDYSIGDGYITFNHDPFDTFISEPVVDIDGTVIDNKIVLWMLDIQEDLEMLNKRFGWLFNLKCKSTERYRSLLKELMSCVCMGTNTNKLTNVLNILYKDGVTLKSTDNNTYTYICNEIPADEFSELDIAKTVSDIVPLGNKLVFVKE